MGSRFAVAFQFLTVLPLFRARVFDPRELARSMAAFPLVGLALGGGLLLVHGVLGGRFPPVVEGAVLTALLAAATGGLHLDGFADTVDGLQQRLRPEVRGTSRDVHERHALRAVHGAAGTDALPDLQDLRR